MTDLPEVEVVDPTPKTHPQLFMSDGTRIVPADAKEGEDPKAEVKPDAKPDVDPAASLAADGKEEPAAKEEPAPEGDKPEDEPAKKEGDDDGEPQGAPEKYEFSIPEGVTLDEGVQTALSEVARELDLSNAQAQLFIDKVNPALAAQNTALIDNTVKGWIDETNSKIGSDKLPEVLAQAKKALAFAPPELRKLLGPISDGGLGLGNHWAVIQGFASIAEKFSEDTIVPATADPAPAQKSLADRMYS